LHFAIQEACFLGRWFRGGMLPQPCMRDGRRESHGDRQTDNCNAKKLAHA